MSRVRLTEVFPFLIPLRQKQRKLFYYVKMKYDRNNYSNEQRNGFLDYSVYKSKSTMINEDSGYELEYQHNKVYNLKLAAQVLNRIVIKPNETFSFWNIVRDADKELAFKDGLNLVNNTMQKSYGGGLCQMSNQLYWLFLHSPLSIIERSPHIVESFPHKNKSDLYGVDATVSEGWLDLKVYNNTFDTFQIIISFDDENMYIELLSDKEPKSEYKVYNSYNEVYKKEDAFYRKVAVCRSQIDQFNNKEINQLLYVDDIKIGYMLEGSN